MDEVVGDGEKWPARFSALLVRGGIWVEKEGRGRGACKAIPPLRLSPSKSAQPRADICTPLPLPLIFREKKKWGRKTEREKTMRARPTQVRQY